ITVTPGTSFVRYPGRRPGADVAIVASYEGAGFGNLAPPAASEKIVGVALRGAKPIALILSTNELAPIPNEPAPRLAADRPSSSAPQQQPYLFLTTELAVTGIPVLGKDGILHLSAT